jgi:diguanylate cyclase (GGDEF)-like protein
MVLVCNHGRDSMADLIDALSRSGIDVRESPSLAQTKGLLEQLRPDAIVLNPLALVTGGVELELLEAQQRDDDPVPVLLLLDDVHQFAEAPKWKLPVRDFLRKPAIASEGLHRMEALLLHRRRYRTLLQQKRQLEGQISVDFKTGLLSEQYFWRIVGLEWKRARRHQNPLSLMFVDVDDFKSVNDATEYAFGDEVLRRVGETLRSTVRETDFAARCGGDEFCLLLPHTTPKEAVQTAMRIRQRVAETVVQKGNYSRQVTVSIGIDAHDGRTPGSAEVLRSRANHALKEAKRRGKNQVWLYTGERGADPTAAE